MRVQHRCVRCGIDKINLGPWCPDCRDLAQFGANPPQCGTPRGFHEHFLLDEMPCPACIKARFDELNARHPQGPPLPVHIPLTPVSTETVEKRLLSPLGLHSVSRAGSLARNGTTGSDHQPANTGRG